MSHFVADREIRVFDRLRRRWLSFKGKRVFHRPVAVFGPFTVVNPKRVTMGSNCAINHGVFLLGKAGIQIGDDVVLSARCMIIDAQLDPATFGSPETRSYNDKPVRIDRGAWIGAGAIILPGVHVGECSIVGAGAVVTRDVPAFTTVAGNPARPTMRSTPETVP